MGDISRGMKDVELVEADGDAPGAVGHGTATGGSGGSFVRRHRWWVLGIGLGLVLALVVPKAIETRTERARVDRLAGVPGVLDEVHGPLAELWSTDPLPATVVGQLSPDLTVAGDTVVATPPLPSMTDVSGLDLRTGSVRWSVPITASPIAVGQCVVPAAGAAAQVVVCVVVDAVETRTSGPTSDGSIAAGTTSDESRSSVTTTTSAHIVVLDPATGEQLAQRPAAPQTVLATLDADLVVVSVTDGAAQVSRVDPRTGDERWEYTRDVPASAAVDAELQMPTSCYPFAAPGAQLVVTCGGTSWVLSADGALVRDLPSSALGGVQATASGRLLYSSYDPAGSGFGITDLGSGSTISIPSSSTVLGGLDDGSVPGLLVTTGSSLDAWDLDTGARLWTDAMPATSAVIVDGTIYTATSGVAQARDARTGAQRWRAALPDTGLAWLATDGRVLLVAANHGAETGGSLTAFDLDDGDKEWTTTFEKAVGTLVVASGHLFATGDGGSLIAFG